MLSLPVETILPELLAALAAGNEAVLEAPPGAGKTTLVPLKLLDQAWLGNQKIVVLEPRRLAARAAAERMAELLGEEAGNTVGYRVRMAKKVSPATRIEVVTEGVLTRWLLNDPSLNGVGLVIFDEFHERSLDADLALALILQARALFREGQALKLLIMSATLDGVNVARLLDEAPVIRSVGRQFPVKIHYSEPARTHDDIAARVVSAVLHAITTESGSVLVFLPGQAEIRRVQRQLAEKLAGALQLLLTPLYGDLTLEEQRQAIEAPAPGLRKVVLATAIAETSLTIEGVTVVIDAGLSRQPVFDPNTGMTRLQTRRLSRAASTQRAGRAGRTSEGVCYRLWSQEQQEQLSAFTAAEILQADLAALALLLLAWGVDNPDELDWLDPPPQAAYEQALALLQNLGALTKNSVGSHCLTAHGKRMAEIPAHPRLAHLLIRGQEFGLGKLASDLAALLSERDPLVQSGADISYRLALLSGEIACEGRYRGWVKRVRKLSQQFQRFNIGVNRQELANKSDSCWIGYLIAVAYPDRIAQQKNAAGEVYQLSNGRQVNLQVPDSLQKSAWLAVCQSGGQKDGSRDRIYLAADLDFQLFSGPLGSLLEVHDKVDWDERSERFLAQRQRRIGALLIESEPIADLPAAAKRQVLLDLIKKRGLQILPWSDELQQWRARVQLLRSLEKAETTPWPDLSDAALLASLDEWLGNCPVSNLDKINHIDHFAMLDLKAILSELLPWALKDKLEKWAPVKYRVPSGSALSIDYCQSPPVLAVRLQEMFGCQETPAIADGRIRLKLHLLSPARRPIQVTQDLAGFWNSSYKEVRKEMRGRYPKHHWPDDPVSAQATTRAKTKGKQR
jgi:ATP-dependent helicase HrpB